MNADRPTVLQRAYRAWMRFAHVLGRINTAILLTVVYAVLMLPMRCIWALLRKDPLQLRRPPGTPAWLEREQEPSTIEERRHPF